MAPNVKQLAFLTDSLADLDQFVQSKYLPLTHSTEPELQNAQQQEEQTQQTPSSETASYWDWPADEKVEQEEEAQVDLFSVERIEQNLVKDAQRTSSADVIVAADAAENDYYWSERVEGATKPQHDDYWFSPAEPQEARIQAILKEEAARKLVSGANIERNLVRSSHDTTNTSSQRQQKPANDAYWSWDSPTSLNAQLEEAYSQSYWDWSVTEDPKAEVSKADIIDAIRQYEAARQILSTQRMEENLKQTSLPECSHAQACNDDYWSWSVAATAEDNRYWDWSAQPVVAAGGYWDGM